MAEDAWLKTQKDFFVSQQYAVLGIDQKKLDKAIEKYNKFIEDALIENTPYVAETLQLELLKSKVAIIEAKYTKGEIKK